MVLFLLLLIAAIVLAVLGLALKGLFYLLIIGAVVFLLDILLLGLRLGRGRRRPVR